jgi:MSHA biogenesis protein MshI
MVEGKYIVKWFSKNTSQAWTAIRSSGEYTCIAQVVRRANAKPLVSLAEMTIGNIRTPISAKTIASQYKLKKTPCSFVLDFEDYQLLQVEKPGVPAAEQKQAVRWKLKDMIDYPVQQATVDIVEIPPDPSNTNRQAFVYAFAAKNQLIGDLSNTLLDSGVNLRAIDAMCISQRNIAGLLEQENRGLAMMSVAHNFGLLTFTKGGELYHARRIEIDLERTANAFERMALEMQRSLDSFERQYPHIAINKLYVAPFAERELFCEQLRETIYIPVETFELSDLFEFDKDVNLSDLAMQGRMMPALGGALRQEVAA